MKYIFLHEQTRQYSEFKIVRFGDSEVKPVVDVAKVQGQHCVVFGSTANPVNERYMELFLTLDALRRSGASPLTVVMPYMGYARQNQQHLPGEPVSAQVMIRILEMLGMSRMITVDLHEEQLTGVVTVPIIHISAFPLLAKAVGDKIVAAGLVPADEATTRVAATKVVIVSPDQGGVERTRTFRNSLATQFPDMNVDEQIAMLEKKRNLEVKHEVVPVEFSGADVADAVVVIPDDVIVSGNTIVNAAHEAKNRGAKAVYLTATHADFIEGTRDRLMNAPVEAVVVADTITIPKHEMFDKLHVVSVDTYLMETVQSLTHELK